MPRKIQRFLLAVLPVLFFSNQVVAAPENSNPQRSEKLQPSAKKPSILTDVFQTQFKPEELKALGPRPSLGKLARSMSPDQKSAAKSQLKSLEIKTSDPKVLAEISQGYMLLGKHQDMARIGTTIQKLKPKSSKGFAITAQASVELGDYEEAVTQAKEALKRNPDDKAAFGALKLSEGRVSRFKSGSIPPAKKAAEVLPGSTESGETDPASGYQQFSRITKSVLANMPVPPELSGPEDAQQNGGKSSALKIAAKTALATAGAMLLFGGLGNKKLEERYPNIKRNMLIGAGIAGLIAVGGMRLAALKKSVKIGTSVTVVASHTVNNPTVQSYFSRIATAGRRFTSNITQSFSRILKSETGSVFPAKRIKPVNLPAWKRVKVNLDHIVSGHTRGGLRASPRKTLFPDSWTKTDINRHIKQAYRISTRIQTQGERVLVRGESGGVKIEMWINTKTKMIETSYVVGP